MIIVDLFVMFFLAAASGCGMGGGGLLVVYLTIVKGVPQITSQALNLLFYIISAGSSSIFQLRKGSVRDLRPVFICSALAVPGIILGTVIRNITPESVLRIMFGILLVIIGLIMGTNSVKKIYSKRLQRKDPRRDTEISEGTKNF